MYTSSPLGTIVIVDDDQNITDLLKFNLSAEGFEIKIFKTAQEVNTNTIANARLMIIDSMNNVYNGINLTFDLKSNPDTADIPIIICSSREGEDLIIRAFDAGADDYVSKPFSLRELIARIKAVLRRHPLKASITQQDANTALSVPNLHLHIDTFTKRVVEDGIVVPLTKTEYSILVFLLQNQNTFFSRNEICTEIWKEEENLNARIVDTNISRLRKKLGESGKYIINRYGLGYAFVDKL